MVVIRLLATGAGSGDDLGVERLIGTLRQDHLGQAGLQGGQHRAGAAVVDDQVHSAEDVRLGDEPFHVHVAR